MKNPINPVHGAVGMSTCILLAVLLSIQSCTKTANNLSGASIQDNAKLKTDLLSGHSYYGITNAASGLFEVYDPDATSWTTPATSFKPTTALGWSATGSAYFDGATDFK